MGIGRKENAVEIELILKKEVKGFVFSANADVWNGIHTDILCGNALMNYYHFLKIINYLIKFIIYGKIII